MNNRYQKLFQEVVREHTEGVQSKGVNDRVEKEQQQEWERVRWLACVNLQPHTKKGQNLTPQKLIKFDWEKKKVKTDIEKQKKRAEYVKKKYELLNKDNG